jgi:acyl dehydratase
MGWSLQLPQALPIYPRGHLVEAAGNDTLGCRLRVVRFVTPVAPGDVIDFYHSRAKTAHLDLRHVAAEGVAVLEGSKGAAAYAVQARRRSDGLTEADIVVNGL